MVNNHFESETLLLSLGYKWVNGQWVAPRRAVVPELEVLNTDLDDEAGKVYGYSVEDVSPLATPRPPKPAECTIQCPPMQVCDHCTWPPGKDDQPPKPAGAVPIPEPVASVYRRVLTSGNQSSWCVYPGRPEDESWTGMFSADQLIAYGDARKLALKSFAREAAGRAVAVPEGWREFLDWCGSNVVVSKGRVYFEDGQGFRRRLHEMRSAPPAAEGAGMVF